MNKLYILFFMFILFSCATKPDIMKQNTDCLHGKINKIGSVYVCLEIGGDAKDRKY